MFRASPCFKIDFDEEDRKRIEKAYITIRKILDALEKLDVNTEEMEAEIERGNGHLLNILNGVAIGEERK